MAYLDKHIPVPVLVQGVSIEKLVFRDLAPTILVLANQLVVGIGALGVLVQKLHVRVRRGGVQIVVQLLDVLAMISLGARHAEKTLFEHAVVLVPQRESKAQPLVVVAEACDAVFAPAVRAGAGLFVRKVRPHIAIVGIILPNGGLGAEPE